MCSPVWPIMFRAHHVLSQLIQLIVLQAGCTMDSLHVRHNRLATGSHSFVPWLVAEDSGKLVVPQHVPNKCWLCLPCMQASPTPCPETVVICCWACMSWHCLEGSLKNPRGECFPADVQVHIDGAVKHLAPLRLLFEKEPEPAASKAPSTAVSGIPATEGKPAEGRLSARRSFW